MTDRLKRWIIPQAKEEAEESYPDMDPELALEEILDETLPKIHKMARVLLREQLGAAILACDVIWAKGARILLMDMKKFSSVL